MMDPINFQAPISPFNPSYNNLHYPAHSQQNITGQKLFDLASSLYAWFGSIDNKPQEHIPIYEGLSTIMLLSKINIEGGNYMTVFEEHQALSILEELGQDLYFGNKTHKEIPEVLIHIIQVLTETNYKAKLVSLTIQLDYRLRIHALDEKSPEMQTTLKLLFESILLTISPSLNENNAQAVAQQLSLILNHLDQDKDLSDKNLNIIIDLLNDGVNNWLKNNRPLT